MRFFSYFIFFVVLSLQSISAQHCLPNGISFNSQSSIDNYGITHPGCSIIDGDVRISGNDITDLSGLSSIRRIQGKCIIKNNPALTTFIGLDSLQAVGSLFIINNDNLVHLTGLGLLDSLGLFRIEENKRLLDLKGLDALTTVEYLDIKHNLRLNSLKGMMRIHRHLYGVTLIENPMLQDLKGLERIEEIDNLEIGKNEYLSSLEGLNNLRFTKNALDIHENGILSLSGLDSYTGTEGYIKISQNPQLEQITGVPQLSQTDALILHSNGMLRDLSGLNGIHTLRNLQITDNKQLGTLIGLGGLETVENNVDISGNANLIDLKGIEGLSIVGGDIRIRLNEQLTALSGLENLTKLGGSLRIYGNNHLLQLDALSQLKEINGSLVLEFNPVLQGLDGLQNIDPVRLDFLQLIGNRSLTFCHVSSICRYLDMGKGAKIEGNDNGCEQVSTILDKCGNTVISGTVFFDLDRDKMQGARERGIPNVEIQVSPNNLSLLTDAEGKYMFYGAIPGEKYSLTAVLPAGMNLSTDSSTYHVTFNVGNPNNINNDFGLYYQQGKHELGVITTGDITRCGFVVPFHTTLRNEGSYIESACFDLEWDSEMQWAGSVPAAVQIDSTGHTARFCIDSLYPFESFDVLYWLKMPGVQSRGDTLEVSARASYQDSTGWISSGEYHLRSPILCAFDPNDKSVNPYGVQAERYTLMNQPLRYRIRFQNVGDIAAENVRIEDALDPALDVHTLKVLQSSHPYRVEMTETGGVTFYFDNIGLADSTSDEAASHGFITYEIAPKKGIPEFTVVENKALIYFDFNPAIVTPTTMNTLVHTLPIVTATKSMNLQRFRIFPLPADDVIMIQWNKREMGDYVDVEVLSMEGVLMKKVRSSKDRMVMATDRWPSGLYTVKLRGASQRGGIKKCIILH